MVCIFKKNVRIQNISSDLLFLLAPLVTSSSINGGILPFSPVWLNYLLAVKQSRCDTASRWLPAPLQFDCGRHQRQRSCSSVRPSLSKSYDFFLDFKFCTNIIRGRIFLLSTSVPLAAGVSSLVTKFGGKHQKDKKKKKRGWHSFTRTLLLLTNVSILCSHFLKQRNVDLMIENTDCWHVLRLRPPQKWFSPYLINISV